MNETFLLKISFVIIVGKRDIMKLFVLPSSRNGSNFDYHNKIYQHLLLPLNQKPRHFNLPLRLSPPKVIIVKMLRRRNTILIKREVLQAHAAQVQILQKELESLKAQFAYLKNKSSQPTSHAQPIQGSRSREGPSRLFYGFSHDAMVGEYIFSNAHNSSLTLEFATSFCPSYFAAQKVNVAPRVLSLGKYFKLMDSHLV